jgi:UDP:flavonoid glycosyltransferase YjiC (YdhE family)
MNCSSPAHDTSDAPRIAYFISPHGFGHAARAAAIMAALQERHPATHFDLFTQVPEWFFRDSLRGAFAYHDVLTDLGMVQHSALEADLDATRQRLDAFLPFDPILIHALAQQIRALDCSLVMCDIAPMGIVVAEAAGVPSILVENFTWDWIYQPLAEAHRGMRPHIRYLHDIFCAADYRIQTEPICAVHPAALTTAPVYRKAMANAAATRSRLGVPSDARVVMLTMGGIPGQYPFVPQLMGCPDLVFVIPGGAAQRQQQGNVVLLPHRSEFFHPDLVYAADAVVGKVGYSTVSEVYAAGIPFGYILREDFREAPALAAYIEQHIPGFQIEQGRFNTGQWLADLSQLLALPRATRQGPNGADQVAQFILPLCQSGAS